MLFKELYEKKQQLLKQNDVLYRELDNRVTKTNYHVDGCHVINSQDVVNEFYNVLRNTSLVDIKNFLSLQVKTNNENPNITDPLLFKECVAASLNYFEKNKSIRIAGYSLFSQERRPDGAKKTVLQVADCANTESVDYIVNEVIGNMEASLPIIVFVVSENDPEKCVVVSFCCE